MRSEFTVEITKFALNLIGQAVNFDHVLGQELLKEEKKCHGVGTAAQSSGCVRSRHRHGLIYSSQPSM